MHSVLLIFDDSKSRGKRKPSSKNLQLACRAKDCLAPAPQFAGLFRSIAFACERTRTSTIPTHIFPKPLLYWYSSSLELEKQCLSSRLPHLLSRHSFRISHVTGEPRSDLPNRSESGQPPPATSTFTSPSCQQRSLCSKSSRLQFDRRCRLSRQPDNIVRHQSITLRSVVAAKINRSVEVSVLPGAGQRDSGEALKAI